MRRTSAVSALALSKNGLRILMHPIFDNFVDLARVGASALVAAATCSSQSKQLTLDAASLQCPSLECPACPEPRCTCICEPCLHWLWLLTILVYGTLAFVVGNCLGRRSGPQPTPVSTLRELAKSSPRPRRPPSDYSELGETGQAGGNVWTPARLRDG